MTGGEKPYGDRRLETRFLLAEPVQITVLGDSGQSCWGQTLNVSATGLSVTSPKPLPAGSPVKLEVTDGMILGEVRFCESSERSPNEYTVGVSVEHALSGWMELYERARALDIVADDSVTTPIVSRR